MADTPVEDNDGQIGTRETGGAATQRETEGDLTTSNDTAVEDEGDESEHEEDSETAEEPPTQADITQHDTTPAPGHPNTCGGPDNCRACYVTQRVIPAQIQAHGGPQGVRDTSVDQAQHYTDLAQQELSAGRVDRAARLMDRAAMMTDDVGRRAALMVYGDLLERMAAQQEDSSEESEESEE